MPTAGYYGDLAEEDISGILGYLGDRSEKAFYDTDQAAAEQSLGGQGFSGARQGLLRRSQIMQNIEASRPFLEGRAGRASQQALQTQAETARLAEQVLAGKQAEQQERLRQLGQLSAQTQAEAAATRQTVLQGQQAQIRLETSGLNSAQISAAHDQAAANISAADNASNEYRQREAQRFTTGENALDRTFKVNSQNSEFAHSNLQLGSTISRDLQLGKGNQPNSATLDSLGKILQSSSGNGTNWNNTNQNRWTNENQTQGPSIAQSSVPPIPATAPSGNPSYFFGIDSPNSNALGIVNNYGNRLGSNNDSTYSNQDLQDLQGGDDEDWYW